MTSLHTTATEDVIRLFFRSRVQDLDKLLELVFASFKASVLDAGDSSDLTIEVNTIFLACHFPQRV